MPIAGTVQTFSRVGNRESLSDVIYNIRPYETPFTSAIGRGPKAASVLEEWQTDVLRAANGDNAHVQGAQYTYAAPDPTVRVGNRCQILRETASVSKTQEAVNKAGRRSELEYQMGKKGRELKIDLETIFLRNQASVAGNASTATRMAALPAWVKSNVSLGSGGANPTYTSGVPEAARTDGTQRVFTEAMLNNVMQLIWEKGGTPKVLMVGPFNKTVVSSTFEGIADKVINLDNAARTTTSIATVDVYVGDFGTVRVIPNRFQRGRDAWVLDPEYAEARYLRPWDTETPAKLADAIQRVMIGEVTLCVKNEEAHGLIADLTTAA